MAKRVNPQRRLRQRQAAAFTGVRMEQSAVHAEEMSMLQQGHVRSGMRGNPTSVTFRAPRALAPTGPVDPKTGDLLPEVRSKKTGKLFPPQTEAGRGKAALKRPKRWSKTK